MKESWGQVMEGFESQLESLNVILWARGSHKREKVLYPRKMYSRKMNLAAVCELTGSGRPRGRGHGKRRNLHRRPETGTAAV